MRPAGPARRGRRWWRRLSASGGAAHPVHALGRERDAAGIAGAARAAAGGGEKGNERIGRSTLDARLEVRRVAGDPQQLELEREHDRVERGAHPRPGRNAVERLEEPRHAVKAFSFASCWGTAATSPRARSSRPAGGRDRCGSGHGSGRAGAGDGLELATPLVQNELDMENGSRRAPNRDWSCERPWRPRRPSPVLCVDVEDAVGFAEPE